MFVVNFLLPVTNVNHSLNALLSASKLALGKTGLEPAAEIRKQMRTICVRVQSELICSEYNFVIFDGHALLINESKGHLCTMMMF